LALGPERPDDVSLLEDSGGLRLVRTREAALYAVSDDARPIGSVSHDGNVREAYFGNRVRSVPVKVHDAGEFRVQRFASEIVAQFRVTL